MPRRAGQAGRRGTQRLLGRYRCQCFVAANGALRRLGQANDVIAQFADVDRAGGKRHLWLVVDQDQRIVFWGQQPVGRLGRVGRCRGCKAIATGKANLRSFLKFIFQNFHVVESVLVRCVRQSPRAFRFAFSKESNIIELTMNAVRYLIHLAGIHVKYYRCRLQD